MVQYKTLYVIGNGFDKFHQIPSGYDDFLKWLSKNDSELLEYIYNRYPNSVGIQWWYQFESNLADIDVKSLSIDVLEQSYYDSEGGRIARFAENAMVTSEDFLQKIKSAFRDWIQDLLQFYPLSSDMHIRIDEESAYFLSFNYTPTLERAYHICPHQVRHIHGNWLSKDLIVGHGKAFNEIYKEIGTDDFDISFEEGECYREITNQVVKLKKPVESIIARTRFWNNLSQISNIFVYGFSFSIIDMPYIEKILSIVPHDANWHISWYNDEDKKRINAFVDSYSITNIEYVQLHHMPSEHLF